MAGPLSQAHGGVCICRLRGFVLILKVEMPSREVQQGTSLFHAEGMEAKIQTVIYNAYSQPGMVVHT
jgi:hypothetical protein